MVIQKEKKIPFFRFLFVGKQTKIPNETRRTGEIANHSRLVANTSRGKPSAQNGKIIWEHFFSS